MVKEAEDGVCPMSKLGNAPKPEGLAKKMKVSAFLHSRPEFKVAGGKVTLA